MAQKFSNLAQMGVEEIFEDLTYNVAYGEVLQRLNKNIPVKDGYLKEALQSGLSVVFAGALQAMIQKENVIINSIIQKLDAFLLLVIGKLGGGVSNILRKFAGKNKGRMRGRFAKYTADFVNDMNSNRFEFAKVANDYALVHYQKQNAKYVYMNGKQVASTALVKTDNTALQSRIQAVQTLTSSINETLLFKLFTAGFTAKDKEIIRKVTGKETVDIDALNQVAEFMFIKDENGEITGLTEAFMNMLNGLGYMRNKVKKD